MTVTYPTTNVELTNLLIDNYYEVKVNAFNGKGHSPFSIPVDVYVGEAGTSQLTHPFRALESFSKVLRRRNTYT